ncbi:MAG: MopE-related protein [Myxococcota bacterium]
MNLWLGAALLAACHDGETGPVDADRDGVFALQDCDDQSAQVFPGADEVPYDGIDQDCDGADLVDADRDGADALEVGGDDCDDLDAASHPGADEVPYDGVDQDCDGADLDDQDDDGFPGDADCDDLDPTRHPGALDRADDGVDQNCDAVDGLDGDLDGFASEASLGDDCDDADPARNPAADEVWYDGVDQDCDDACDHDQDGDGAVLEGTVVTDGSPCDLFPGPLPGANVDCDDADPSATVEASRGRVPDEGDLDFPVDDVLTVELTVADPSATLAVSGPDGGIAGALAVDGATVTFRPDAPLTPGAGYTTTLTHRCGVESWTFTAALPRVPVDPATLVGGVWELPLDTGEWVPGGSLIVPYMTHSLLVSVAAASADVVDLTLGSGLSGTQDLCAETTAVPAAFVYNPEFGATSPAVFLTLAGAPAQLHDAEVEGVFAGGGATLVDVRLAGLYDTAPLALAVFGAGAPEDAVCSLIGCAPCPDGSLNCVDLVVSGLEGARIEATVVERTAADIAADPACP